MASHDGLLEGGDSGEVVMLGDAQASLLYRKLRSSNPKVRMPQEEDALTADQIETLRRWIDAGAAPLGCGKGKAPSAAAGLTDDHVDNLVRRSCQYVAMK